MAIRPDVVDDFHLHCAWAPEWEQRCLPLRRQRLPAAPAVELSVSQAAGDAGFEHLGHFGTRYRDVFGELPSQTLRKTLP
ncbi:AraC-like DNA-binding protein [Pelomonas saccharophila]|uniref:AraC-like DNA-binding protein n=1 Tax=Roseateles saccharophilus TaxID=304 RepID=A0ABU1YGY4_ROSSA|nr:AraC-like DNA-binding protein [Roseateles saccharophilus]